jgi:hypothetical protein
MAGKKTALKDILTTQTSAFGICFQVTGGVIKTLKVLFVFKGKNKTKQCRVEVFYLTDVISIQEGLC